MTFAASAASALAHLSPEHFRAHMAKARANLEFLGAFHDDTAQLLPAPEFASAHLVREFAAIVAEGRRRGVIPG